MSVTNPSPETFAKAYGLIGEFMFNWAHLEFVLNESLGKVFGIESALDETILVTNMTVREKINAVRTRLLLEVVPDSDDWKGINKLMDAVGDRSADRNLVAHTSFATHPKGVVFYVVKAKGRFDLPKTVWSEKDFQDRFEKMRTQTDQLRSVVADHAKRTKPYSYANALAAIMAQPSEDKPRLGLLDFPESPPKGDLHSHEATPETSPQSDHSEKG